MVKFGTAVFYILFCLMTSVQAVAQDGPPPALVTTTPVVERTMMSAIQVPGTVISQNDARIAAEIDGRIVWVAEVGTAVEEGDIIARIDDRLLRIALTQAQAAVARLEADLRFRDQEVERLRELAENSSTPISRFQEAVATYAMTEQDLITARANLERAEGDLARAEVRAPFPGRVVSRLAQIGEYAVIGAELVRLVDTVHMEIRAQVPITIWPYLEDGMMVETEGEGRSVSVPIRSVIPVGDEISRTLELRLSILPDDWVIGTAVKVNLPSSHSKTVLAVPRDALIVRTNAVYVIKIENGDTARRVDVVTGISNDNLIEVQGDLAANDEVVIRGGERLQDGRAVTVSNGI